MLVGLYVRVSTQEQANEGYSVGEQSQRLQKYAEAHDWIVYNTYIDAGFTGANMDRPALQEMIQDIKAGKLEKVVVWKLDRLSRSQKDTLFIIEDVLNVQNVGFVSMKENFDTTTPFGRAIIGILAAFAQLEREQIKERTRLGIEARAKSGLWTGSGMVPYGYEYIDNQLVINDYEAIVVKRIFDKAIAGKGPYLIAKELNAEGYRQKSGLWNANTVRYMLASRTYAGYVNFEDNWYKGKHKAIVSLDKYEHVQALTLSRKKYTTKKSHNFGAIGTPLSGLIYCAHCGSKYRKRKQTKQGTNGTTYVYENFLCSGRYPSHGEPKKDCHNKTWPVKKLQEAVFDELRKISMDPEYLASIRSAEPEPVQDDKPIRKEITKIENQISKLMDLYAVDSMPVDVLQDKIKDLADKKAGLIRQLETLEADNSKKTENKKIIQNISALPDIIENGTINETHMILSEIIEKIEIDGEDITIFWKF